MTSVNRTKEKNKKRPKRLPSWKKIGWGRRILRIGWITVVVLVLFSWLQVLLGAFINPPLTPLMVQRFFQQVSDDERPVRFERDYVSLDRVSPNLITAVVHSEDGLFMYHNGFDVKQMKIAYKERHAGKRTRGASTISQQTAKNVFLPHSRTIGRKAAEAYYTIMIEAVWSKRRIMEVYLNVIEFGDGIYGCEAASQHYFGHSADKLTRSEAAQLAATLPSPLRRNPAHPSPYFKRRAATINQYFKWGMVDIDEPKSSRKNKYKNQESLWDFFWWYLKQK
jgi:monofunctional biosynthetic peptidoglycan transglycosylase